MPVVLFGGTQYERRRGCNSRVVVRGGSMKKMFRDGAFRCVKEDQTMSTRRQADT